jgi:hypothetical protein
MNASIMQTNETISSNIVFVNHLLEMLSKRNDMDLHECYIVYLIHDLCMNVDQIGGFVELKQQAKTHLLVDYYRECVELGVSDLRGLNIQSPKDKQRLIDNYLTNVGHLIELLQN